MFPTTLLNSLTDSETFCCFSFLFLIDSTGLSTWIVMSSANKNYFNSSFPITMTFFLFSWPRKFSGGRLVFLTNGAEISTCKKKKDEFRLASHIVHQNNSKWTPDLNLRAKTPGAFANHISDQELIPRIYRKCLTQSERQIARCKNRQKI